MKLSLLFIPFFIFLQTDSCGDDTVDDGGSINENFVEFLGVRNEAAGGCNIQSMGNPQVCTYVGSYNNAGQGYTISISHTGDCRTATFNLRDNLNSPSNAQLFLQITENGVAIETYLGNSGTVNLGDFGSSSSMEFEGTVISSSTGEEETISGFMECVL